MHDTRTVSACTITWHEDSKSGRGYLNANFDDGGSHECEWPGEPISAKSDSSTIADYVANELSLEVVDTHHDGSYVHATMIQR